LGFECHGAYFDETKAERRELVHDDAILIEPGGNAERIGKQQSESLDLANRFASELIRGDALSEVRPKPDPQRFDPDLVCGFGIETEDQRPDNVRINACHR
jgi:hypothetical protein